MLSSNEFKNEHESELSHEFNGIDVRFHFRPEFQQKICASLIRKKDFFIKFHKIVKYDYFAENFLRQVFKIVKRYFEAHRELPDKSVICEELLSNVLQIENVGLYKMKLDMLYGLVLDTDDEYLETTIRTFAKKLYGIKVVYQFQKGIDGANTEKDVDLAINKVRNSLRNATFYENLGVEIFSNTNIRELYQEKGLDKKFFVPTGLSEFDRRTCGGLESGQVGTILGTAGIGKSHILVHMCKTGALSSMPFISEKNEVVYNPVVYITQELDEQDVHDRILASLSGIPIKHFYFFKHNPSLLSSNEIENVEKALNSLQNLSGYIRIKYFKPKQLTPQGIYDYLYEVEQRDGIKVRALYHDYMKKLSYEEVAKDDYKGLGYICTQLISIAQDFNIPIWSPMQLNRASKNNEQNTSAQVGNSWEIIEDLDVVIVLNPVVSSQLDNQVFRILVDKCRRAEDKYDFYISLNKACSSVTEYKIQDSGKETSQQSSLSNMQDKDNPFSLRNTFISDDAPF